MNKNITFFSSQIWNIIQEIMTTFAAKLTDI